MVGGLGTGILVAFLGWDQVLRFWPLALLPLLFTRFYAAAAIAVFGCLLAIITVAQLNSAVAVIPTFRELQYGEALIYEHAARILRGEALYQSLDRPPFTVVYYTPLYYWLVAGLQAAVGPGFVPGRVLTLVAGLVAASLVGYIVGRRTRRAWAGVFAALLFLSLGLPWVFPQADLYYRGDIAKTAHANLLADLSPAYPNLALYKEDLLGVALSLGAVAALVGGATRRRVLLAGVLAALAVLTKQTFLPAALAGFTWLWVVDRRQAAFFGGVALSVVLGTGAALELTTGAFLANAVFANVNPMGLDVLASNLPLLARFQGGLIAIAGVYALKQARALSKGETDHLLVYFWLASLLPLAGLAKVGSSSNHWIGFAAATAILAALGLWSGLDDVRVSRFRGIVPIVLLAATLAVVTPLVGGPARMRPSWPQPDPSGVTEYRALVDRVRSAPGGVLSAPLDALALADRPILLDPYIFSILERERRWDPSPIVRRICGRQIGLLIFYNPLEYGSGQYHGYAYWPASVLAALQETMVLDDRRAGLYIYVPRPAATREANLASRGNRICPD